MRPAESERLVQRVQPARLRHRRALAVGDADALRLGLEGRHDALARHRHLDRGAQHAGVGRLEQDAAIDDAGAEAIETAGLVARVFLELGARRHVTEGDVNGR
jgi:hypothetical protein